MNESIMSLADEINSRNFPKPTKLSNAICSLYNTGIRIRDTMSYDYFTVVKNIEKYLLENKNMEPETYVMKIGDLYAYRYNSELFFFSDYLIRIGADKSFMSAYDEYIDVFDDRVLALNACYLNDEIIKWRLGKSTTQACFLNTLIENLLRAAKEFDMLNNHKTEEFNLLMDVLYPTLWINMRDEWNRLKMLDNTINENSMYPWIALNWKKLLSEQDGWNFLKREDLTDMHNRPDLWMSYRGENVPVECKLHDFTETSLKQLNRYMKAFNCKYGLAIAEKCTAKLPKNIFFVSVSKQDIKDSMRQSCAEDIYKEFVCNKDKWNDLNKKNESYENELIHAYNKCIAS